MQFDKFTIKSQEAIQASQNIAEKNGQQEIMPEHLLLPLLEQKDGAVIPVLQKMGGNLAALKDDAHQLISNLPKVSGSGFGQVYLSQPLKKVLDESFSLASSMQDEYVSQEHLFLALIAAKGSVANMLQKEFARQTIARLVSPDPNHVLSRAARAALIEAIEAYDRVATNFGPHERPDSSRCREVGAAIEKYGLAEEIGARQDASHHVLTPALREAS